MNEYGFRGGRFIFSKSAGLCTDSSCCLLCDDEVNGVLFTISAGFILFGVCSC